MIHELMAAVKASVRLSFALKDPERTSACSGLQINMPPICDSPLMCVSACVCVHVCGRPGEYAMNYDESSCRLNGKCLGSARSGARKT